MITVKNSIIPFGKYKAINLFGLVFYKKSAKMTEADFNHERIHTSQMRELLYIPFYIWYGIEYFIRLIRCGNARKAYRGTCFEYEAYKNEKNLDYLKTRKHYCWIKFV